MPYIDNLRRTNHQWPLIGPLIPAAELDGVAIAAAGGAFLSEASASRSLVDYAEVRGGRCNLDLPSESHRGGDGEVR